MKATMMLCDFADVANGKLYITGGGWSLVGANQTFHMALALLIKVPWDQANRPHEFLLSLLTEDGDAVMNDDNQAIGMGGKVEVGRPPGLRAGTSIDVPIAFNVGAIKLAPQGYEWRLVINDQVIDSVPFAALNREA